MNFENNELVMIRKAGSDHNGWVAKVVPSPLGNDDVYTTVQYILDGKHGRYKHHHLIKLHASVAWPAYLKGEVNPGDTIYALEGNDGGVAAGTPMTVKAPPGSNSGNYIWTEGGHLWAEHEFSKEKPKEIRTFEVECEVLGSGISPTVGDIQDSVDHENFNNGAYRTVSVRRVK